MKLTTLVSPIRPHLTIPRLTGSGERLLTNKRQDTATMTSVTNRVQEEKRRTVEHHVLGHQNEEQRNGRDCGQDNLQRGDRGDTVDAKTAALVVVTAGRPTGKREIEEKVPPAIGLPLPVSWRVGAGNTNHGNNTSKRTGKDTECTVQGTDPKTVNAMEQYVTAKPFVPLGKPAKKADPASQLASKVAAVRNGTNPSDARNANATTTRDTGFIGLAAGGEEEEKAGKRATAGLREDDRERQRPLPAAALQPMPTNNKQTFQLDQRPIPVIEQGVVHHRHPSPPTICPQQTAVVAVRHAVPTERDRHNVPEAGPADEAVPLPTLYRNPTQTGAHVANCHNVERHNGPPTHEPSGWPFGALRTGFRDGGDDRLYRFPHGANIQSITPNPHQHQQNAPFRLPHARQIGGPGAMGEQGGGQTVLSSFQQPTQPRQGVTQIPGHLLRQMQARAANNPQYQHVYPHQAQQRIPRQPQPFGRQQEQGPLMQHPQRPNIMLEDPSIVYVQPSNM